MTGASMLPKYFFRQLTCLLYLIASLVLGGVTASAMTPEEAWSEMQILMEIPRSEDKYADEACSVFIEKLLEEPELFVENVTYVAAQIPPREELSDLNLLRIRETELRVMVQVMVAKARYQKISKLISSISGAIGSAVGFAKIRQVKKIVQKMRRRRSKSGTLSESEKEIPAAVKYLIVISWTTFGYLASDLGMALVVDPAIQKLDETSIIELLDIQLEIHELRGFGAGSLLKK